MDGDGHRANDSLLATPTVSVPTLTAAEAARFLGCKSAEQFRREVQQGIWPPPIAPRSRPQRWSVAQLQAALQPQQAAERKSDAVRKLEERLGVR